jgi:hypothetical protein
MINEIPVILMGHNYTVGILKHEYIGSQKIIKDLQLLKGWEFGLVNATVINK